MGFFDLNIPYTESNKRDSTVEKSLRLKLAVKAMELGYTGVAYNRTITGVMSERDRCSISLFPLSSVLKVSPFISSSVNLHRRLLNVPTSTPFRQYTRLTVVVDTLAQGAALNAGNPILKSYDIVAVRPLKQESFDQACKNYEVDIIAIEFSENRFRLKQPLIKAAIERGICFEITYSGLLMDAQLRRQIISNAKLLVDWTRGKNLIFSSAAPSVTELRGPYDVANLASLLGFSTERAKSTVSRTCRSLLENALRKKKFHKETIRVELISSAEQTNTEGAGFDDWLNWDPISSGDGDLQLDDMAKSFAASGRQSKTVKAIDFVSIIDGLPSHGLHINDIASETKAATKAEKPTAVHDVPVDSELNDSPENAQIKVMETLEKGQFLNLANCDISPGNGALEAFASVEGSETCPMIIDEKAKIPGEAEKPTAVYDVPVDSALHDFLENGQTKLRETLEKGHLLNVGNCDISSGDATREAFASVEGSEMCPMIIDEETKIRRDSSITFSPHETEMQNLEVEVHETLFEENVGDEKESANTYSALPGAGTSISWDDNPSTLQSEEASRLPSDASLHEDFLEGELTRDTGDVVVTPASSSLNEDIHVPENHLSVISEDVSLATSRSHDELQSNDANSVVNEPLEDMSLKVQVEFKDHNQMNLLCAQESSSDRVRRKQGSSRRSVPFPFKRLLKPSPFKKVRKLQTNNSLFRSLHKHIG